MAPISISPRRGFPLSSVTIVTLLALAACGGGNDATVTDTSVSGSAAASPSVATCLDGTEANSLGVADPFESNAWHLNNTGPGQIVSASDNSEALAGIDARVVAAHLAGKGCTGKGVTIAIVDSGLELAHEDLAPNILASGSFNFNDNTYDPSPVANQDGIDHGTGVAGIAAARGWNGKGSRGTAPLATLVGFNSVSATALGGFDTNMNYLSFGAKGLADPSVAATTAFAERGDNVSIFNYSAGSDYAEPPEVTDKGIDSHQAIKSGVQNLRKGLGALYFQAAGNEYERMEGSLRDGSPKMSIECATVLAADVATNELGTFSYLKGMSCGNPNQEPDFKPYMYVVAGINNTGKAASYSNASSANWITGFAGEYGTAKAAIITTDNSGCTAGNNNASKKATFLDEFKDETDPVAAALKAIADLFGLPTSKDVNCHYTGQMNGTSSATPSVSGIAALLLEVNPKLTWRDVGYILAKTARKVDNDIANTSRATTYTAIGTSTKLELDLPWQTNSAGFNFQNRYGFGLIDAEAATKLARGFVVPAGRRATDLTATTTAAVNKDWGDDKYADNRSTVTFANATAVSGQMQLDVDITNNTGAPLNMGRLQFEMVNTKSGQKSILLPAFTSWYAGGKASTRMLSVNAKNRFRMSTNAFYGDKLSDGFTVNVVYVKGAGVSGGALGFTPTVTSFSQ